MKKIVIAVAIALTAFMSQAAQIKWVTSGNLLGVDTTAVDGNGDYSAAGNILKNNSTLNFTLQMFTAGTEDLVDSVSAAVKYATGRSSVSCNWAETANVLAQGTTYDYILTITGSQSDLRALGVVDGKDYSAAIISAQVSGTMTTARMGPTTLKQDIATWMVSGVVPVAPVIPEPTTGLLVLLGLSCLALKRKRA